VLVSIFKPVVPVEVAVTAANAANVSPEHVTVTAPADSLENAARVKVMVFDAYFDVVVVSDDVIVHELSGFAEIRPAGNVREILLAEDSTRVVDVTNVTVIDCPVPVAWLPLSDTAVTAPTAGVVT
jgi:hypothetical protein